MDSLFLFSSGRLLTRTFLVYYRASLESLAPSTMNVRLSAIRKMVGEARKHGMRSVEEAAHLADLPNIGRREPG